MSRYTSHKDSGLSSRMQLWALFALIIYTPLPLASNRTWAIAILAVLTGTLFVWTLWFSSDRRVFHAWKYAQYPLVLMSVWVMLLAIQLVPLPDFLLDMLHYAVIKDSADQWFVSNTISIDPYSTRLYLAKACVLAIFFWLLVTLINTRSRVVWLARVVVLSGLVQALIGVVLMSTGTTLQLFFVQLVNPRAHGTFVYPNHYAGYLEMTLAMGIGLMIASLDGKSAVNWRQRIHGWLSVIISAKAMLRLALIIMVVGLVASRSRGGNSAFFASLLIIGVITVIISNRSKNRMEGTSSANLIRSTVLFISSLIVIDIVIIGGVVGVEKVVQRIEHTNIQTQTIVARLNEGGGKEIGRGVGQTPSAYYNEQSLEERSEAAIPALQIVRDFPWLGSGGGTFYLAFPHYRPPEVREYYDHPHNDYVEFASEVGLLGFLLLAITVLHSIGQSFKLLAQNQDQLARGMSFASLMGILSLLLHGAVDFNFQNPTNAMMFITLLGMPYMLIGTLKR